MILALLIVLAQDGYHQVPLAQLASTRHTHACTVGRVVYVRRQKDGDLHVTLSDGAAKVVAEFMPSWTGAIPRKGQRIRVCGVTRFDKHHGWPEIHPVTQWEQPEKD